MLAQHDEHLLCPIPPSKQPSPSSETASTTREEPSRGAGRQQPFGASDDTPLDGVFIPLNGVNRRSAIRCDPRKGRAASRWPSRDSTTAGPSEAPVVQQVEATGDALAMWALREPGVWSRAVEPGSSTGVVLASDGALASDGTAGSVSWPQPPRGTAASSVTAAGLEEAADLGKGRSAPQHRCQDDVRARRCEVNAARRGVLAPTARRSAGIG